MNRTKKFILTTIFVIAVLILCMSTKVLGLDTSRLEMNDEVTISQGGMESTNNVYCVAHGKTFSNNGVTLKVRAIITIEGKKITGTKADGTELTVEDSQESSILAAILGGPLEKGYGTYQNYNEAQQALYGYWNTWVDAVGNRYGFQKDSGNNGFQNSPYIEVAKKATIAKDYKVTIYLLHPTSSNNWQELIAVDVGEPDTPPETEPTPTTVPGIINISGYVWEDIANTKSNTINSKYEDGDIRLQGIIVHWRANDGSEIASTITDEDGSYKLSTTIDLYNHPYGIKDKEKYDKINNSYIEFEYNGLKYTTVAYNGNLSNADTSKGKENEESRTGLDNKFDRVENRAVYDGNNAIISGLPNTQITDANYASEFAISASTKNITRALLQAAEANKWTETMEFCTDHCGTGEGPHLAHTYEKDGATIKIYCNGTFEINDPENKWTYEEAQAMCKELMGDEYNEANGGLHYYSANEIDGPTNRDCRKGEEKPYVWNINNMNLGLVRREQPDAAITSDIEKVRVIMKNQEYTYIYGNRGIQDNEELFDYKVKFGNKYVEQQYSRPVNPADIAYVNYNNSDDLKVYVTYNIILKNQSNTLPMSINEIVNYYDSNYTIYTGPGTSTSVGWQEANGIAKGTNNGYKIAYNTSLSGIQIQPGEKSEIIKIEFEVNQDRIKGLLNEDATLYNVSEIFSFTTYYGENTICAERETAATKGKTGQQYAGLDIDSTPGNAIPGNVDTYEDDTDKAPSFLLMKNQKPDPNPDPNPDPEETLIYRTMSGTVYEDAQTAESKDNKERLGNGQKEENEKGVANVKVELLDADTGEIAYLYYKDSSTDTGANKKQAVVYTDENGNYSFGDENESGVVVGNYIIKYTYGNDTTELTNGATTIDGGNTFGNARNYKSTIITESNVKSVMQGSNSDKWYLNMNNDVDVSIAVDDLKERLEINSLKYSNYDNGVNMSAYTKPLTVQIEYTQEQIANVDQDGGEFEQDCPVFDFGIMERAREDIVINKTISKIKVTLANGQVLIEGDPRNDSMNYVKALGFRQKTDSNGREIAEFSEIDKMITIEIDSELIQGATLEVWYSITVTNNSEIDYEYQNTYNDINQITNFITTDSQANYYYYGNKDGLSIITRSAEIVADYMNPKLVCNIGSEFTQNLEGVNNTEWFRYDNGGTQIDADYLKNSGYISYKNNEADEDKTYETIKNGGLQTIATNTFADLEPAGGTKTSIIYASTLLANQEDGNLFDNHVEIIQINGKIGRTINSVKEDTREQVSKTYQPGNYIPTLGSEHQQDDDRVRIVVTPPTGITNYTTIYIIATVVGLIVVMGGIFLIKKMLIKK